MGSKKEIGRARRSWEKQLAPVLEATSALKGHVVDVESRMASGSVLDSNTKVMVGDVAEWENKGKAVYLMDETLADELMATPLPEGGMPHSVFDHVPHDAPFIVFNKPIMSAVLRGDRGLLRASYLGFVLRPTLFLDGVVYSHRLLLVGKLYDSNETFTVAFDVPAGKFEALGDQGQRFVISDEYGVDLRLFTEITQGKHGSLCEVETGEPLDIVNRLVEFQDSELGDVWDAMFKDVYVTAINMVLYVSADNCDLESAVEPRVGNRRVVARSELQHYRLGFRVGSALREARRQRVAGDEAREGRVAAHLRRAHWHRYWTGPKAGERTLVLRWVNQTLVNAGSSDFVPTVRTVR